jgi:hypothetical protein
MRGDSVEIVIDVGGATRTYYMRATRAGRRVEVSQSRGAIEVAEVTRSGTPIRTARFMAGRVVAVVEHPSGEQPSADAEPADG